jgi:4-hydroxy 2-oxovalerate aldolase
MHILDVTLRDGGFVNDFTLGDEDVAKVIALLDTADVDGIEMGYLTGLPSNHGLYDNAGICYAWSPERIAEVAGRTTTPLVGMLHPEATGPLDLKALAQAGLSAVRVPVTLDGDETWRTLTDELGSVGLPFTVNLTLASWATPETVTAWARTAEQAGAFAFYVADTNSAMLPAQVEEQFTRMRDNVGLGLGFHAHDCKGLALANVLAAWRGGADWADSSLAGLGRGAGNAATEVLHEITGRDPASRNRLLRALPWVTKAFGACDDTRLWRQLCAFMDFSPPAVALFENAEAIGEVTDKYALLANRLLGQRIDRPRRPAELRKLAGLGRGAAG